MHRAQDRWPKWTTTIRMPFERCFPNRLKGKSVKIHTELLLDLPCWIGTGCYSVRKMYEHKIDIT